MYNFFWSLARPLCFLATLTKPIINLCNKHPKLQLLDWLQLPCHCLLTPSCIKILVNFHFHWTPRNGAGWLDSTLQYIFLWSISPQNFFLLAICIHHWLCNWLFYYIKESRNGNTQYFQRDEHHTYTNCSLRWDWLIGIHHIKFFHARDLTISLFDRPSFDRWGTEFWRSSEKTLFWVNF